MMQHLPKYEKLKVPKLDLLIKAEYFNCKGDDAANYTLWGEYNGAESIDVTTSPGWANQIIQYMASGKRGVTNMKNLKLTNTPDGSMTVTMFICAKK